MNDIRPASGAGAEIFDGPSVFYLTHQAQIDEWYRLRSTVSENVGEWYRTVVRDALAVAAETLGYVISEVRGADSYPSVLMHTADTVVEDGQPALGVGLAWSSKTVLPTGNAPFSAVRRSGTPAGRAAGAAFLADGGLEYRRTRAGVYGSDSDTWPVYRTVDAPADWWTDLDRYRDRIVDDVIALAVDLRDALDAGFSTRAPDVS